MNILHITTFLQGGAGKIIRDLAQAQKMKNNNVYILTSLTEETGYSNYPQYIYELDEINVPLYRVDSTFKRDIYKNINVSDFVRRVLIEKEIDIIHAHAAVPALTGLLARINIGRYIPIIQTMHGWGTNKTVEHENMDVFILNSIDKIITVSKSDKGLLIGKGVNRKGIEVVYNGVEESVCAIEEDDLIRDINYYKKNGYLVVGSIGTLCKRKNQELMLEALSKLDKDKKIFCTFIGEGDLIGELEVKINEYKLKERVKFYGYRESANKYIKYFNFLAFTSDSEGLSITLLEGFREKIPVIASDIPSFTECVTHKKNGFLFKHGDANALKELLEKINTEYNDEKKNRSIVDNAYNDFIEKFTLNRMLYSYDKLYKEVIDGKNN